MPIIIRIPLSGLININLPDIAFNVNTQYPFRRKETIGELKWYENIGVALNTNVEAFHLFMIQHVISEDN